jgi:hypothetical protein
VHPRHWGHGSTHTHTHTHARTHTHTHTRHYACICPRGCVGVLRRTKGFVMCVPVCVRHGVDTCMRSLRRVCVGRGKGGMYV